ncbi:MAG TPA: aminotransferase class IV [Candidatus Polarisedimenticolia bacterium]|jgi:branched-chain amino acid aminotransferase
MSDGEFANVNGSIAPLDRATVSVNDHGFLYGDGVYETVRTYDGRPFLVERHLERLERSAAAIRLRLPWSRLDLAGEIDRTLAAVRGAGGAGEFAIRIMTTRGPGPLGYDPDLCPRPTLVILARFLKPVPIEDREIGIAAIVAGVRRNPIEALDPRIKSTNLLNNILAAQQAKDAGAAEAILCNTAGFLAEGTLTNVFFVKDGAVRTPSLDCGILSGVTRDLLLELGPRGGLTFEQGRYRAEDLSEADEIFVTSTTREILPVALLDGRPVGSGSRGPITQRLQVLFRRRVAEMSGGAAGPAGGP